MEKHGCQCGHIHPSLSSSHRPSRARLSSLGAYGYARAVELERVADSGVYVVCTTVALRLATRHRATEMTVCAYQRCCASSYAGTSGARSAYLGILWVRMRTRASRTWGWRICAGALWVCVHPALPSLALALLSLAIFLFKLGRIPLFCTI
ncbi:hypothetical protein B0H13DRAFT_297425 [Mycena leptocephala]|nr:hypothetical protein B0H13DRAFT_297425 [Mycena leptocephala]